MRDGVLDGLADGDAEAAERLRVLGEHGAAGVGVVARAGDHVGAPELHHAAPVGLLVVAHLDHVDDALEVEHLAGHAEGAAPLAGAGLGGEALGAVELVVVRLRDGRVALVRAGRADALVLEEDLGRRVERLLEAGGADQRRGPPHAVDLVDLFGDLDVALGRDLLGDDARREDRREVVGAGGLQGAGVQRRGRRLREGPARCCTRPWGSSPRQGRTSSCTRS